MKGYKVFESDWTCRDFQYEVGKTYEIEDIPILCKRGFHFCEKLIDCFRFYGFTPENRVAEVEALGEVIGDGCKSCTNKIFIIRELSWDEVLQTVNTGRDCEGLGNTGNTNSGSFNTGHFNSGSYNCGKHNNGSCNSGDYNSGDFNDGNYNSGSHNIGWNNAGNYNSGWDNSGTFNTGDYNSGHYNTGDWNLTNNSTGCFNTTPDKIRMFNKPSEWTYYNWRESEACRLLSQIETHKWIHLSDMNNDEKFRHPEAKVMGGYLKELDRAEAAQAWWDDLTDRERDIIRAMPNFDAKIFEEITGIKESKCIGRADKAGY